MATATRPWASNAWRLRPITVRAELPEAGRVSMRYRILSYDVGLSEGVPRGNASILDQLRRAATSIPLNIAEAAGRAGEADAGRAYAIARGSAMECAAVLDALTILKLVDPEVQRRALELLERIVQMLTKLCR